MLAERQQRELYKPLALRRVRQLQGKFSYLEAWDVAACLGYIFGVENWDDDTTVTLVYEEQRDGKGWDACYKANCRLAVKDPQGNELCHKSGDASGSARNQPSRADAHDLAIKDASSSALKRAAIKLGDQFGLSLYDNGSLGVLPTTLVSSQQRDFHPGVTVNGEPFEPGGDKK
jgi:recombination DNA repair RAD52 pathway protein